MKVARFLLTAPSVLLIAACGTRENVQPEYRDALAYQVLLNTSTFCSSTVGDGGDLPYEVYAIHRIWEEPWAKAAFGDLLERATLAGQLYALCGLYHSDREHFDRAVTAYEKRAESIETQAGCEVSCSVVRDVVKARIATGRYPEAYRQARIPGPPDQEADLLGKSESYWLAQLETDGGDRDQAIRALFLSGPDSIPALNRALTHREPLVREHAAGALSAMGPWAAEAIPALIAAINDPEEGVRTLALEALRRIGPAAREAIPALRQRVLQKPAEVLGGMELHTLARLGADGLAFVLERMLDDNEVLACHAAEMCDEAAYFGDRVPATVAVPILTRGLEASDACVRSYAALLLRGYGRAAAPALPRLRRLLKDASEDVRDSAAEAIAAIEGGE